MSERSIVVHFLGDREKIRGALDDAPLGAKAEAVHEQGEPGNHLGHAAAVVGRIEIRDAQALELPRLLANPVDGFGADEQFVIFDLRDARLGHLFRTRLRLANMRAAIYLCQAAAAHGKTKDRPEIDLVDRVRKDGSDLRGSTGESGECRRRIAEGNGARPLSRGRPMLDRGSRRLENRRHGQERLQANR